MSPEYGATCGFWPIDEQTLAYLRLTGRPETHVALVAAHARASGLFRGPTAADPAYDRIIEVDLSAGGRAIAGPAQPHNGRFRARSPRASSPATRLPARTPAMRQSWPHRTAPSPSPPSRPAPTPPIRRSMIGAGLFARNALERGLSPPPWVKTSLAPGSRAVTTYLERAGLLASARGARLSRRGLWLHHLRRQVRAAEAGSGAKHRASGHERRGRALRQPQLRRPDPSARRRQLSLRTRPRHRLCARRPHHARYRDRCHRRRPGRRSGAARRSLALRCGGRGARCSAASRPRCSRREPARTAPRQDGPASTRRRACRSPGTPLRVHRRAAVLPRARQSVRDGGAASPVRACSASSTTTSTTDHISPGGEIPPRVPAGQYLQERGIPPAELQHLCRPPRQPPRHGPRHLRQRAHPQPDDARPGRLVDKGSSGWRD